MGLLRLLRIWAVRRKQRSMLQALEGSSVRYSDSPGISLENPVVITGAHHDLMGTMAVFAWLIRKRGTMNVDWRIRVKRGHHDGQRHIDIYDIQTRLGVEETFYFDLTESWGKLQY
ncbi:MAG: hypothetical protein AMS20_08860 [Gemmatimonas sp. SG8_28]|jgi:hypothetical protein|nr:MAG: hypothetical protein AMS20_08860 [Gemmatimonas sp. SG8_28]